MQPPHVRIHHPEGVATLFLGVSFLQFHEVAFADVPGVGVVQVSAEQIQGERVTLHILDQLLKFVQRW